jgi:large subunit ribosomal protein L22
MQGRAETKYIRMSPRKMRRVADLVRGKRVEDAINILHFTRKSAALPIEKTIRSAVANVINIEGSSKVNIDNLVVKNVMIDAGPTLKRFRPMSMGRGGRIRKRTAHITVLLEERIQRGKVEKKPETKAGKAKEIKTETAVPEGSTSEIKKTKTKKAGKAKRSK